MRKSARLLLGSSVALITALGMSGCANAAPGATGTDNGLRVVTTTTQLYDFTQQLTEGLDAKVTSLFQPGASVHSFEPTAADLEQLRTADVLVANGMGLEPWLNDTVESAGFKGVLVDASAGITPLTGDDHADHADHEDAQDHAQEDSHDHSEGNPHIWTSPDNAITMVNNVAKGLAGASAGSAAAIQANAKTYTGKLEELNTWIKHSINQVPAAKRLLATNHDALTYYDAAYGITFVGSVMPSWDDNAEPSVAEVNELVARIKESGVPAVFTETQLNPATAQAIAQQAGVKVYSGEDALYTDSLGAAGTPGATYIGATIHNTTQILDSWGYSASAVPSDLA